jgi:hypothetical protein
MYTMERTETEVKILTLRQRALTALRILRAKKVVQMAEFFRIQAYLETCNELLFLCRQHKRRMENLNASSQKSPRSTR